MGVPLTRLYSGLSELGWRFRLLIESRAMSTCRTSTQVLPDLQPVIKTLLFAGVFCRVSCRSAVVGVVVAAVAAARDVLEFCSLFVLFAALVAIIMSLAIVSVKSLGCCAAYIFVL